MAEALAGATAAFVAAPVRALPGAVREALAAAGPECVVTDVGSTKRELVGEVDDPRFIGGHPLAGAETAGVEHARAELFDGATWYLTPTPRTEGVLYDRLYRLLADLGARPAAIDAETHDRLMASVSHLPHVLANVLVAQAARRARVRAAAADRAELPRRHARRGRLDRDLERHLPLQRRRAGRGDRRHGARGSARSARRWPAATRPRSARWNDAARDDRRRLLEADLAGGEVVELRVSVPNRPGVVAEVALALGRASVNIVDMALYPAADNTTGSIALWIAGDDDAREAEGLIAGLGFTVARP